MCIRDRIRTVGKKDSFLREKPSALLLFLINWLFLSFLWHLKETKMPFSIYLSCSFSFFSQIEKEGVHFCTIIVIIDIISIFPPIIYWIRQYWKSSETGEFISTSIQCVEYSYGRKRLRFVFLCGFFYIYEKKKHFGHLRMKLRRHCSKVSNRPNFCHFNQLGLRYS